MAEAAFDCESSPVLGDDPLRNGQTQADAALLAISHLVDAIKALENLRLILFGDSNARVLNCNCYPPAFLV